MQQKNESVMAWLMIRGLLILANLLFYNIYICSLFRSRSIAEFVGVIFVLLVLFIILSFVRAFNVACLLISQGAMIAFCAYYFSGLSEIDHHNIEYFFPPIAKYFTMWFIIAQLIVFAVIRGVMYLRRTNSPEEKPQSLSEEIDNAFEEPTKNDLE